MNAYQKYKEKSILSMSGPELVLLLFEEADKRLARAGYALEDKDYGNFDKALNRTFMIVQYLIQILDLEQPISQELREIYQYVLYDIGRLQAGRERRKDEIPRIRQILSGLKEAFDHAWHTVGMSGGRAMQHDLGVRG